MPVGLVSADDVDRLLVIEWQLELALRQFSDEDHGNARRLAAHWILLLSCRRDIHRAARGKDSGIKVDDFAEGCLKLACHHRPTVIDLDEERRA